MRMNCENRTWSKAEQCNRKDYPTFVWYLFKYLPVLWKIFYHLLLVQTIHLPYAIRFLTMEIHTQEIYAVGLASGTLHYFKEICLSWRKLLSFKKKMWYLSSKMREKKTRFFLLRGQPHTHTQNTSYKHITPEKLDLKLWLDPTGRAMTVQGDPRIFLEITRVFCEKSYREEATW